MTKKNNCPVVFWHSDPVLPGETVLVSGYGFDENTTVEICRMSDGVAGAPGKQKQKALKKTRTKVSPLQRSAESVKFLVPAHWGSGIFCYRLRTKNTCSEWNFLNVPDCWWFQADAGEDAAAGGWLRIFGKCLGGEGKSIIRLEDVDSNAARIIKPYTAGCYSLACKIPRDVQPGNYRLWVHNGAGGSAGWVPAGLLKIRQGEKIKDNVFNVVDYGARPNVQEDSTNGILMAIHLAESAGGGIVYFPRGRYRIDCPKRHLYSIPEPIKVPSGVILRGEGMNLVSLVWPERKTPLPCLIMGSDNFTVEDLTIYTQGRHNNIIEGNNNVKIHRVRIRANCYYRVGTSEPLYKPEDYCEHQRMGDAIRIQGKVFEITDCDIYHSSSAINLDLCEYGLIARNIIHHSRSYFFSSGCRKIIFEDNECYSNALFAHGGSWSISWKYGISNLYFARNFSRHHYGGDRENITTDNHGTAYFGYAAGVSGTRMALKERSAWGFRHKDELPVWHNTVVYVLSGKGSGQYRKINGCKGRKIEIDRPWTVEPDSRSVISIGVYNGKNLFIENRVEDAGSVVQLYPPNSECIVAKNINVRGGNINCGGHIDRKNDRLRVEPSWYNQFLDNVVPEGNGWGAGGPAATAVINGVLGGEGILNIYGINTFWEKGFISRWHVVRRHLAENNSSIRVGGSVSDVVIEGCRIKQNERGIWLETTAEARGTACGQKENKAPGPACVLMRNNKFEGVLTACVGEPAEDIKA